MNVLITGAAGQDGSYIANAYHAAGHEVLGVVPYGTNLRRFPFRTLGTDLASEQNATTLLDRFQPNLIFHLAAVHFSSSALKELEVTDKISMIRCHVNITRNILEWQSRNLDSAAVFALSSQMYSFEKSGKTIDETSPLDPQSHYGETKKSAFLLIKKYREDFGTKSHGAILFNHTSVRSKDGFILPVLASKLRHVILNGTNQISLAEPNAEIDITHSDEICEGLMRQIKLPKSSDLVYARGESIKISDLVLQFLREVKYETPVEIVKNGQKVNSTLALVGDSSKAHALIGWQARKTPLEILLELFHKQTDDK